MAQVSQVTVRSVAFTVPGRIGGKQRAGRKIICRPGAAPMVQSFNPKQTASQERMVRQYAALAMRNSKCGLIEGPVSLTITVFRRPPPSWSQKRKDAAVWITGKPDCDNTVKLIADSVNGIVWNDDAQIALLAMQRFYNAKMAECVVVSIRELVTP